MEALRFTLTDKKTPDAKGIATACLPIIERLLAERDIDALLDGVGASGEFFKLASGKWCVPLWTALEVTDKSIGTYGAHEHNDIVGSGDTFTEALRNAVQNAKEQGNE